MVTVITYTEARLLEEWKLRSRLEPLRTDCVITCTDGIDMDTYLLRELRAWYMRELATAPVDTLPLTDIAPGLTMTRAPDGAGMVKLPAGCLRVVSVEMEGWHRPAVIVTDPECAEAVAQTSPYSRGGVCRPVAVIYPDRMMLYTPPVDAKGPSSVLAVTEPPEGTYLLTEQMLADMPLNLD